MMGKIDSEKAYKLAEDARSALDAEVVIMFTFKDGGYTGDIVGHTSKLPVGIEDILRRAATYIEGSRT